MKFFICSEDPDCAPYVEAENIAEAKEKMCESCIEAWPEDFECDGPIEADPSKIFAIEASQNLLIKLGNYIHKMKQSIMELISAIDNSTFCEECCDKGNACSICPWFQNKSKALKLLKQEEE
ncbi:hypothetical protein SDC9_172163 [bioreactor metagenome]|uniref:Uncharacterized protein n=1 Tax=bioreactor metagenome TaxID=1076179 RepID=A0A645GCX7_9ZZZZ|nr:hypothetical protein [Synergistaceae bacterium]